jgi:hypothetical protein
MTLQSPPTSSTSAVESQAIEAIAAILVDHAEKHLSDDRPPVK